MIRCCLMITCLAVSVMSIGCCGPMGCGPGCGIPTACNDCDGVGTTYPVHRPLDRLRNFKRTLVCGSGCGGKYVGEWISTPPDACDPCCGDRFVGGATPCRPFCWQPGALFGKLYGSRFCSGAESSTPCGCEGMCDGGCIDGGYVEEGYIDGGVTTPAAPTNSCGCASCNAGGGVHSTTRTAQRAPAVDNMTRSARQMNGRANYLVR